MKLIYEKYFNSIVLAGVVFILSIFFSLSLEKDSTNEYQTVLINEGDTLWTIANEYEDHALTKVEFIDWIEEHNEVYAERLQPGQTIVIPIKRGPVKNLASLK